MISAPSSATLQALRTRVEMLDPALRGELSALWARDAQYEHASIASFGRFALELLAVAAPAELIERAHRAAIEEIEHARLCFTFAGIYGGSALGPGPLPIDARIFANAPDLHTMTRATVLEGCVNESVAALEAGVAARQAQDEAVREALLAIERQEGDHASLAFAFVSWAVNSGGAALRETARVAFKRAGAEFAALELPEESERERQLSVHGRLSSRERASLRKRAFAEVIVPAAEELLGPVGQ
ncbi:MAG TPA: hypothetical protein VMF89_18685 [Polyangiales bacterium]|nr:hypothetical protein [Polyangiales bacterium]